MCNVIPSCGRSTLDRRRNYASDKLLVLPFPQFFRAGNVSAHEAVCDDSDWLCRKRQKSSANKTNTVVRHEDVADGQLFLFRFGKMTNVIFKHYTTEKI